MLKVSFGFVLGIALCAVWLKCRLMPQYGDMEQSALTSKLACDVRLRALVDAIRETVE